jgi:Radical SAM superfamily
VDAIAPRDGASTVSLDRLNFILPDRAGLPALERYAHVALPDGTSRVAGYTEASRGCRHLCRHCPIVPVYQGVFRVVPRDIVLADIRQQVAAGATHITFGDPDFLNGPAHAMAIIEAMHREFPALTYDATIKVEHLLRQSENVRALRDSGCLFVTTAAESVDDAVLDRLDKGHTRADFLRVLATFRQLGMVLQPTFVPFTPWTTLESYRDLLSVIAAQGLVENVTPIQLGIRLLIPAGSRLLELGEVSGIVGDFDPAGLLYPWKHPDPRVDALSAEVQEIASAGDKLKQSRAEIFARIWRAVASAAGASDGHLMWRLPLLATSAAVPRLSEPWYCCAEPTQDQFVAIGAVAPQPSAPAHAPTGAGDFL